MCVHVFVCMCSLRARVFTPVCEHVSELTDQTLLPAFPSPRSCRDVPNRPKHFFHFQSSRNGTKGRLQVIVSICCYPCEAAARDGLAGGVWRAHRGLLAATKPPSCLRAHRSILKIITANANNHVQIAFTQVWIQLTVCDEYLITY